MSKSTEPLLFRSDLETLFQQVYRLDITAPELVAIGEGLPYGDLYRFLATAAAQAALGGNIRLAQDLMDQLAGTPTDRQGNWFQDKAWLYVLERNLPAGAQLIPHLTQPDPDLKNAYNEAMRKGRADLVKFLLTQYLGVITPEWVLRRIELGPDWLGVLVVGWLPPASEVGLTAARWDEITTNLRNAYRPRTAAALYRWGWRPSDPTILGWFADHPVGWMILSRPESWWDLPAQTVEIYRRGIQQYRAGLGAILPVNLARYIGRAI